MQTASLIVIGTGALLLVVSLIWLVVSRRSVDARLRKRLLASETSPTATVPADGNEVCLSGAVAPASDALLSSPLNRQPCVLYRFYARRQRGSDTTLFETLHKEAGEVPFWLDDGSGELVLVRAESFQLVLVTDWEVEGERLDVADELRQWLASVLGQDPTGPSGRRLRFEEKWISPGQTVTAIGSAHTEAASDGSTIKVIGASPTHPLFLTNLPREQAAKELGSNTGAAVGFSVASLIAIVVGVVLGVI